ncbi:MAG: YdcF family protein [Verrucomicrobia bacterium]|nr:YdcF family protein [Verrucomicrobiota bacterium]
MRFWNALSTLLRKGRLVRDCSAVLPTGRGLAVLAVFCLAGALVAVRGVYPFLAVTERLGTEVLVVEGWVPDFALRAGWEEYRRGGYRELLLTGGPLERGSPLFAYGNHAEVARETLVRFGAAAEVLRAVPAPAVRKDRTYASALALRDWMRKQGRLPQAINVLTTDVHARRTRLLFERAFGSEVGIGIVATPDERFDAARWWRSSMGVRTVLDEVIGYVYARCLFALSDDAKGE